MYYTYITTNKYRTVLYIGVTNNIIRRLNEHKEWSTEWFTSQYNAYILIYYEQFQYINDAIAREKQLKKRSRKKKFELIQKFNNNLEELVFE